MLPASSPAPGERPGLSVILIPAGVASVGDCVVGEKSEAPIKKETRRLTFCSRSSKHRMSSWVRLQTTLKLVRLNKRLHPQGRSNRRKRRKKRQKLHHYKTTDCQSNLKLTGATRITYNLSFKIDITLFIFFLKK